MKNENTIHEPEFDLEVEHKACSISANPTYALQYLKRMGYQLETPVTTGWAHTDKANPKPNAISNTQI